MTKKVISKCIVDLHEDSVDNFIANLKERAAKAEKDGYKNIRVSIETEREPYSDFDYAKVSLVGNRLETDAEYKARMDEEEQYNAQRRRVYELMKKEFGDA